MSDRSPGDITSLLLEWNDGNVEVLDELMPLVFEELRSRARHYLRNESPGHTLDPAALVSETYLRLIDRERVDWRSRANFFAFAARTMRRILVDHARKKSAAKRGGEVVVVPLDEATEVAENRGIDLQLLDAALTRLAEIEPLQAQVVEMRFFAGLQVREVASVLDIGEATVVRKWAAAKAWLYRYLTADPPTS